MPDLAGADARGHAFWLASRGAQQMDLALRFADAAAAQGLRILALKGISIADELYGGVHNRPMADIDFLVVDTRHFGAAGDLVRSLGLDEAGASDHAIVFKEPASGVVLELHLSLTACPGLFTTDHGALWERRASVAATPMFRLSNEDLPVHLALHTGFQHGFAANAYHYDDFIRVLAAMSPPPDQIVLRARESGALRALGAMVLACGRLGQSSLALSELVERTEALCPRSLSRWIRSRSRWPPPAGIGSLAYVRYQLAPAKWSCLRRTLLPAPIPGRTLPRPSAIRRLASLVDEGLASPDGRRRPRP
ncbi:MAG: nucleotidyltransferase family protein [Vicinamibacteria bacterium]